MAEEMKTMPGPTVSVSLENDVEQCDVEFRGGVLTRDRPNTSSQRSSASNKSGVTPNPNIVTPEFTANNLFSHREGAVENAVKLCRTEVLNNDFDGDVVGFWLITEIDHWDLEKERLIMLTSKSLLIINFDFIRLAVNDFRRYLLPSIRRIQIGDLIYPQSSLMPPRQNGGVRIQWSAAEPSLLQRWNPLCSDLGYVILSHHLLAYRLGERETTTFDVGDLANSLVTAVNKARRLSAGGSDVVVDYRPIMIESYGSVASMVFNQSHLGFNLARGGISF